MSEPDHKAIVTVVEHREPKALVHPLVEALTAGGPMDPSAIREILSIQRDYEAGEAKKAFDIAQIALKADMPAVLARDSRVDYMGQKGRVQYSHASLAAAMDAITGPLAKHGFSLTWTTDITDKGNVEVVCCLAHVGGHAKTSRLVAPPDTSGGKNQAQAVASTSTLLQRYTALSLLGIATADMKEPAGPAPDDAVDTNRNMRAAAAVKKAGRQLEEAEAFLGRGVQEWTTADLERLREWLKGTQQ